MVLAEGSNFFVGLIVLPYFVTTGGLATNFGVVVGYYSSEMIELGDGM